MWKQFLFLWKPPKNCFLRTVFSYRIGGKKSRSRKCAEFLKKKDFVAHELMCFTFSRPTLAIKSEKLVRAEIWVSV